MNVWVRQVETMARLILTAPILQVFFHFGFHFTKPRSFCQLGPPGGPVSSNDRLDLFDILDKGGIWPRALGFLFREWVSNILWRME